MPLFFLRPVRCGDCSCRTLSEQVCPGARAQRRKRDESTRSSKSGRRCSCLMVESLPRTIRTAILRKVRPLIVRFRVGGSGRLVFSSSGDPIRATGTKVALRDSSLVSTLVSSMSGVAESLFATLFPSDCRLCGTPLANISRLPVCLPCLSEITAHRGWYLLGLRRAAC